MSLDNKNKGQKNTHDPKFDHLDKRTNNTASAMDCTGLIPFEIQDEAELASYEEIYDINNDTAEV